jgi:hypothetical protein
MLLFKNIGFSMTEQAALCLASRKEKGRNLLIRDDQLNIVDSARGEMYDPVALRA